MGEKQNEADGVVTPALRRLLQRAVELGTTNAKQLAEELGVSENTVRTEWERAARALGTHSRYESLDVAVERDLIVRPPGRP